MKKMNDWFVWWKKSMIGLFDWKKKQSLIYLKNNCMHTFNLFSVFIYLPIMWYHYNISISFLWSFCSPDIAPHT